MTNLQRFINLGRSPVASTRKSPAKTKSKRRATAPRPSSFKFNSHRKSHAKKIFKVPIMIKIPTRKRQNRSPTPQRLSFANFGRVNNSPNKSPATPNRNKAANKSPATPNRNKAATKIQSRFRGMRNRKLVNALKTKKVSAAFYAVNAPTRFARALNPAAQKIKELLSLPGVDWQYGMLCLIGYLIATLNWMKNPRMTNNAFDVVIQTFVPNQFPQRFIGGKPPIPDPPVELTMFEKFLKFWSKTHANKKALNRVKQRAFNVYVHILQGFLKTGVLANGRSMAGKVSDFTIYIAGIILFMAAWFPYTRPGARRFMTQIFTYIQKAAPIVYGVIVVVLEQQYRYDINKENALNPLTMTEMFFTEGMKFLPHAAAALSGGGSVGQKLTRAGKSVLLTAATRAVPLLAETGKARYRR